LFVFLQEPKIVSDRSLAIVVRQMALHCNLASIIQKSLQAGREPYASNWLERLRAIKRLRDKVK
jgi:tuberous sclerosis protein 2